MALSYVLGYIKLNIRYRFLCKDVLSSLFVTYDCRVLTLGLYGYPPTDRLGGYSDQYGVFP